MVHGDNHVCCERRWCRTPIQVGVVDVPCHAAGVSPSLFVLITLTKKSSFFVHKRQYKNAKMQVVILFYRFVHDKKWSDSEF